MKLFDLIGVDLKHDVLNDLFETEDVDVVYWYDRTHENMADQYHAEVSRLGLQFIFDENQKFSTLFITKFETEGFNPFESDEESLTRFASKGEALQYAGKAGIPTSEGKGDFMGEEKDWVRFEYDGYSVHYEFVEDALRMITIQAGNA